MRPRILVSKENLLVVVDASSNFFCIREVDGEPRILKTRADGSNPVLNLIAGQSQFGCCGGDGIAHQQMAQLLIFRSQMPNTLGHIDGSLTLLNGKAGSRIGPSPLRGERGRTLRVTPTGQAPSPKLRGTVIDDEANKGCPPASPRVESGTAANEIQLQILKVIIASAGGTGDASIELLGLLSEVPTGEGVQAWVK